MSNGYVFHYAAFGDDCAKVACKMGSPLKSGNVARMLIWLAWDAHAEGNQAMMQKAWYSNRVRMLRFHAFGDHTARPHVNQRRGLHHVADLDITL